jgi:hypothetical protein
MKKTEVENLVALPLFNYANLVVSQQYKFAESPFKTRLHDLDSGQLKMLDP